MNQPQPAQPKPPLIRPRLLATFIIVLLIGAGYFGWYFWSQRGTTTNTTLNIPHLDGQ